MTKEEIYKAVMALRIDYGDCISKSQLCDILGIDTSYRYESTSIDEYEQRHDAANWDFLRRFDIFKEMMREHRLMHIEIAKHLKTYTYQVVRPCDHAALVVRKLDKGLRKVFSGCIDIINATNVKHLSLSERSELERVESGVRRVNEAMTKSASRVDIFQRYKNIEKTDSTTH